MTLKNLSIRFAFNNLSIDMSISLLRFFPLQVETLQILQVKLKYTDSFCY